MNELAIYDVSAFVNRGMSRKDEYYGYPTGGINYLMDRIAVSFINRNAVVLCFDSPSFRKEKYSEYKCGRSKNPAVYSQIETLFDGLQKCGIRCEKYSGFEADDIVEWAVQCNLERYRKGIVIWGNDVDLCHSIRPSVQFRTLAEEMNDITSANFETALYAGVKIPFNTISAYKVFCGCNSDKIPAIAIESGYRGYQLYQLWCNTMRNFGDLYNFEFGAIPKVVEAFIKSSGIFTEEEKIKAMKNVELVYPAEKPEGVDIIPTTWEDVDKYRLQWFLSQYGCRSALKCLDMKASTLTENEKQEIRRKANELKSGAYAADRNLEHNTRSVKSSLISLDAFEKEF